MFPLIQIVILEWEGGAEARRGEGGREGHMILLGLIIITLIFLYVNKLIST